jgi:hypothetical protein
MAMNPYLIIGALVGAIAIAGASYFKGRADGTAAGEVKMARMVDESRKAREAEATAAYRKAEKLEVANAEAKIVYRAITKEVDRIVDRPIYRDGICFDDDGLRIANDAITGKIAPPAKPDPTLPGTDSVVGRAWRDGIKEIGRSVGAVPRVPPQ